MNLKNIDRIAMIAAICHQANQEWCAWYGDYTQPSWRDAPQWQIYSAIDGVAHALKYPEITPEDMHSNWRAGKIADGWVYGEVKDPEAKTHPCMIPYDQLPEFQRKKDAPKPKGEREVRKMSNPNYARVRAQVSEIREQFGLIEPPVNPVDVARGLGINVHFVEFEPDFANVSGFYDPDENAIVVNKQEFPLRQTFTIAHELGHALLHREWAASEGYRVLMRDDQTDHGEPHEREANAFAAHLLVPRDVLDKYSGLSPQDLSRLFAVSVPMIKNRLMFEYG